MVGETDHFINVLRAAFACTVPKSTKRHFRPDCLFALLGSACVKAACKHVGEIDPWRQFHQHFRSSVFANNHMHIKIQTQTASRYQLQKTLFLGKLLVKGW
jgi:hypothetical protein